MKSENIFKWIHFASEATLLNLKWYLGYVLGYRNLEKMMADRGLKVEHPIIYRWVQRYSPELEKRIRPYLRKGTKPCT